MPANAVVCSTPTSSSPPPSRLSPSFNIEDILELNQATTLPISTMPSLPLLSSPPSPSEQPTRHRHRRTRTIYTPNQLASMESMFACNQYPGYKSREALADAIDLTEARIHVWFQNRRARERRQRKRQTTTEIDIISSSNPGSRPPSAASSTKSATLQTPSTAASPTPCSSPESSSPPATGYKTSTVPSPPPSSRCTLSCCSPSSIYSPYLSIYVRTPQCNHVPSLNSPYGQLPPSAAYSYSAIPASYAYPSSAAAYYYHPSAALTNVKSTYRRPTVFNFPSVASVNPGVSRVPEVQPVVADSQTVHDV